MTRPARRRRTTSAAVSRAASLAVLVLACALPSAPAGAQAIVPSTIVQAVPGAGSVTVNGTLKGPNLGTRDYVVRLDGGRTMNVRLDTTSPDTWFSILHPYGDTVYSSEGDTRNAWSGRLVDAGEYRVRVTLGADAARQGKGASYTLRIGVDRN